MSLMFAHDAVAPRAPAKLFAWEECARAMLIGCWFLQDAISCQFTLKLPPPNGALMLVVALVVVVSAKS